MEFIIKRDGRKVKFNEKKILHAINKAIISTKKTDETLANRVTEEVIAHSHSRFSDGVGKVEDLQDLIEEVLINHGEAEIAKRFILYRHERTRVRESKTRLMKTINDITFKDSKENDSKRENANIDGNTAMGTMLKYGSETSKEFYLSHVVSPRFSEAHRVGDIHIHDLDFYSLTMTCCQIDLVKLFEGGFSTGNGFLREPNDIRSYASLACIAIQSNQNDQHGGQSVPNFDYAMALGVRKTYRKLLIQNIVKIISVFKPFTIEEGKSIIENIEARGFEARIYNDLFNDALKESVEVVAIEVVEHIIRVTEEETKEATFQAMEALIHNLNTMHSRAGAQVPFSSLNYGTDTSHEGRIVIDNLLEATMKGLGNGETPIFPIQIFKVKEGINFNHSDINYDLFQKAILTSSKRLFPNFSFLDAPFNKQYYKENDYNTEIAYMGCRTRVISNVDKDNEIVSGRGNLSFTSLNLPRLALRTKNVSDFYIELDRLMELIKDQLLERYEIQCGKKVYNFPFLKSEIS